MRIGTLRGALGTVNALISEPPQVSPEGFGSSTPDSIAWVSTGWVLEGVAIPYVSAAERAPRALPVAFGVAWGLFDLGYWARLSGVCCGSKRRGRNAFWARWRVRRRVKGKAGPSVRPDNSQIRGYRASRPGVAAQPAAAEDDAAPGPRAARLGVALAGVAQELAGARPEAALLERENAALRSRLMVGGAR